MLPTSPQQVKVKVKGKFIKHHKNYIVSTGTEEFGKRHDTTDTADFCPGQLVTDLSFMLRTCYRETGVMDFGLYFSVNNAMLLWYNIKVLNGSRVVQGSRHRVPRVQQFSLPAVNTDAVVTWTRRHIGPVTSLSEPRMSRAVTLTVGETGIFYLFILKAFMVKPRVMPRPLARDSLVVSVLD